MRGMMDGAKRGGRSLLDLLVGSYYPKEMKVPPVNSLIVFDHTIGNFDLPRI
jgi:hypothetical protein